MRQRVNLLLLTAGMTLLLSGCAHFGPVQSSTSNGSESKTTTVPNSNNGNSAIMNGTTTTDSVPVATLSTAIALQDYIANKKINELRTVYNGMYGASLLFHADELTYYVALFQRNDFWRVIQTKDVQQAEKVFEVFTDNTRELAAADIQRIRLQAEYRYMEKQLAVRSTELDSLRSDLAIQRQHERAIAAYQQRTKAEASRLTDQQRNVQTQLRALQRQIDSLEEQKNQIDAAIDLHLN